MRVRGRGAPRPRSARRCPRCCRVRGRDREEGRSRGPFRSLRSPRASGLGRPPLRASLARDAADAGPEARGRGGSSARARAAPAPPPPSAARGAGAPWARRGSRAAGASDIAPGVRASIHVLWLSSVRVRPADLCFRRHIPSGLDYSEAPLEAAASRSAAGPAGDGPGGAHAAAAVAAVAPRLPAPRCRLPGRLPLLQRHGGVRRPAAARRPARYPTRDAGGHRVGPAARREGRVGARWGREPPPRREQPPTSLRPADAVPAGQQHRAPGPGSPGASRRPAPPLPAQQQPARPGARRLPRAVPPAGAGAHREPAARPASRRLLGPGSAACALPGGDCRSCTCRTTALSCWRTKPWRGSPHWRCWTSAGTTWEPSAARPSGPWPACRSCASQRTLGAATAPCTGWEPGSRRAASGCSAPGTRRSCAPSPRAWRCRASWTFPAAASSASRPRCTWSRSRRRPTWARTCGWPARLRATRSPWSPGERWRSRATGSRGRRRRRRAGRRAPAARAAPTRAAACCSSATSPWPTPASTSARPPTPAAPPACPSSSWSTCPGRSRRSPRRRRPRPPGPSATSRCRRRAAWPSAPWAWPRRRPWRPPSRCWRSRRCCWPP
ncbi:leucine-rich repeat-containing protein 24 isoform X3 [Vulpes vulpes]|uniref:Leucine-rich repeat-containing protein 24 isoform X3 n=1 Tax=Vulpes vulpes TaxID=9627 RepID=A0ABM4ZHE8_VULVU